MKHSRSRLLLIVIFCSITLNSPSIADAADAKSYCARALSNANKLLKNLAHGKTALMYAAQHGDVNFVLEAVRKKFIPRSSTGESLAQYHFYLYVNHVDSNGKTALMYAAEKGHKDAVITLIRAAADINIKDGNNKTASIHAAENGHHDIAEMLTREDILDELGGLSYVF